ncbi:hypothetical protein GGI43DRAFT_27944 [Trichoderma evansii]
MYSLRVHTCAACTIRLSKPISAAAHVNAQDCCMRLKCHIRVTTHAQRHRGQAKARYRHDTHRLALAVDTLLAHRRHAMHDSLSISRAGSLRDTWPRSLRPGFLADQPAIRKSECVRGDGMVAACVPGRYMPGIHVFRAAYLCVILYLVIAARDVIAR